MLDSKLPLLVYPSAVSIFLKARTFPLKSSKYLSCVPKQGVQIIRGTLNCLKRIGTEDCSYLLNSLVRSVKPDNVEKVYN